MTSLTAPVPFAGQVDATLVTEAENPRWDLRFLDHWIIDLVSHWGEWRRPRSLAPRARSQDLCVMAREAKLKAERIGFVIEADHERGYRVVDFIHPERIYMVKTGRPLRDEPEELPDPCQLQLCSEV